MSDHFNLEKLDGIGSGVDLNRVPQISKKRLITFINEFIITTVTFFNNFAQSCETKLFQFDVKMQKLEAELCILESKLNSVPGLEVDTEPTTVNVAKTEATDSNTEKTPPSQTLPDEKETKTASDVPVLESESEAPSPASQNPKLAEYFKLLHLGVPEPAVRLKMQHDGIDPNLLVRKG